jgi:predicted enzyme related to lactoylglutathione lyase
LAVIRAGQQCSAQIEWLCGVAVAPTTPSPHSHLAARSFIRFVPAKSAAVWGPGLAAVRHQRHCQLPSGQRQFAKFADSYGFQRADGYRAPSRPDQEVPRQLHVDFEVDDLDRAEARVRELGAAKPDFQPNGDRARVFTDPAGHPFCLVSNPSA